MVISQKDLQLFSFQNWISQQNLPFIVCALEQSSAEISADPAQSYSAPTCALPGSALYSAHSSPFSEGVCLYLLPIYLSRALTKQIRPRAGFASPCLPSCSGRCKKRCDCRRCLLSMLFFFAQAHRNKKASAGFEIIQHNRLHFLSCMCVCLLNIK